MRTFRWISICCIWILTLLTTGCSTFVENNKIEEIAPVVFWSLRQGENGKVKISTLAPPLINEKKRLLSLQVDLLKLGSKDFNFKYYRELKNAQIRLLMIDEGLAKQGIHSLINTLSLDPEISSRLYLVVTKGNVEDYINSQLEKQEDLDFFIYLLFKHYEANNEGVITVVNLHEFIKKLYSPYASPIMPVFKVSKEDFTYEGTAFFQRDRLITIAKAMDEQVFQLFNHHHYAKLLSIPELSVGIGHIRLKQNWSIQPDRTSTKLTVDLHGSIEEYRGDKDIMNPEEEVQLNREIQTRLEIQTKELLTNMQRWKVDPLQVGNRTLRPFARPVSEQQWFNDWEHMKIDVSYRIHLHTLISLKTSSLMSP
ncbi:Ger(x)C family spore germination C-terminal domain-containing protein [Paenibacillus sp. FSL H7-0331]|uniref:Ger(x)C family spore germination protein n=1 Tax=Paenibacillus sp. FSL H7-0331 TaxID=1920421 RepID=UPI00096E4392|nr:Ger(x)C family spore germination C-terminal domain-containing protein [Paenibacillus sp. FSL H7-0331]OMF16364.1 spore gernimation protein [Paenibacillus sp. FSL H7-0331]